MNATEKITHRVMHHALGLIVTEEWILHRPTI